MSDAARLRDAFASGALIRPDAATPNLVDLAGALGSIAGATGLQPGDGARLIHDRLAGPDHHVFVLVDGLGMNQIARLPGDAWLARHAAMELRTVFVSSTAPALTSLATGLWPNQHAVTAWWTYLPAADLVATILPFVSGPQNQSISPARSADAFPAPALLRSATRDVTVLQPRKITGSVYSNYFAGGRRQPGYVSLDDAMAQTARIVRQATTPTYTYVYVPEVDTASHTHGPASTEAVTATLAVDAALSRLARAIEGRARMVVSADHGGVPVPREQRIVLSGDDPLLALLRVPVSGEPRARFFHVQDGRHDQFERQFRERFGRDWVLLSAAEAEELHLFGPGPTTPEAARRYGDYCAIALDLGFMVVDPPRELLAMRGTHGGLHPDEMRIPLVVA